MIISKPHDLLAKYSDNNYMSSLVLRVPRMKRASRSFRRESSMNCTNLSRRCTPHSWRRHPQLTRQKTP